MTRLENWAIVSDADPYTPPEGVNYYLIGAVYGHTKPRHYDGKEIRTSRIVSVTADGLIVTKSGSQYQLGQVDPQYEKEFPDAQARVLKAIERQKARLN